MSGPSGFKFIVTGSGLRVTAALVISVGLAAQQSKAGCEEPDQASKQKCEKLSEKAVEICGHGDSETQAAGRAIEQQGAAGQGIGAQQANQCQNQTGIGNANQANGQKFAANCRAAIEAAKAACSSCQTKAQQGEQNCTALANSELANPPTFQQGMEDQQKANGHRTIHQACRAAQMTAQGQESQAAKAASQAGNEGERSGKTAECEKQASTEDKKAGGMPQMPKMPEDKKDDKKEQQQPPQLAKTDTPSTTTPDPTKPGEPGQAAVFGTAGPGAGFTGGGSPALASGAGGGSYPYSGGSAPVGSATTPGGGGGSAPLGGGGASRAFAGNEKTKDPKSTGAVIAGAGGGGGFGGGGGGGGGHAGLASSDFEKFMKRKEGQGVGGMSLKPVDGITGPMGASIFEKITKQYKLQQHNMIP